jgi:uncharacterized membrane protein
LLALRYDARAIAVLALFGGYLSPILASSSAANDRFLGLYIFILNAVALTLVRRKSWLSVEFAAAVGTLIFFFGWIVSAGHRLTPIEGSLFVAMQFGIFVHSQFPKIRAMSPVPAMAGVAFLCGEYSSPAYWSWAAIIAFGGIAVARSVRDTRLLASSFAGWVIGFLIWYPEFASHASIFAGLTVGFGVYLVAAIAFPDDARRSIATYTTLAAAGLFYYAACYVWLNDVHPAWMGLLAVSVAAVYAAGAWYLRHTGGPEGMQLMCGGLALVFVTLAIPIQLSGYSITLAWAVESAVLAYVADRFGSRGTLAGSWIVAALAIVLLFSADAGRAWGFEYRPLLNGRFVPFVVTAVSLAANAYWTKRMASVLPRDVAVVPFLAAHFTLLAAVHMELFAWIRSEAAPEADLTSRLTLGSSVLFAVYGLALLAHGMSREFRIHRMLGLGLFAIVVGKL